MSEMKLAVLGAAGRMGQTLARAIAATEGCVLAAGIEAKGSPAVGRDLGEVAGLGTLGIPITDDPLPVFAEVHGVLDFTTPKATVAFAGLAAQARIVDVIGTTGLSADDQAKIEAAARHAAIVKAGNMSLGVNLLAGLTEKVARTLGPEFDIEILELHHRHKRDAPSGTALLLGEAAASGRGIALKDHSARARDGDFGPRREGDIGFAALRGGDVVGEHRVIFAGPGERSERRCGRAAKARGFTPCRTSSVFDPWPVNLAAESGFWFITWQNMGATPKVPPLPPERAETEPRIEGKELYCDLPPHRKQEP
jgi:4-hydroxy-tetrahydrodipicolinate reductase